MPFSSPSGKPIIDRYLRRLRASGAVVMNVLDVGCGQGFYCHQFRSLFNAAWTGVEAWKPYIAKYRLDTLYDKIIHARIQDVTLDSHYEIAFLGDVLEHMSKDDAVEVFEKILKVTSIVIMSIPIGHYPQGEYDSNPFEVHVKDDWTHEEVLATFRDIAYSAVDNEIGVYIACKSQHRDLVTPHMRPRIACYTVARDEAKHVRRWVESNSDADYRLVADTGSKDATVPLLRQHGVTVHRLSVTPWRWDVARNAALALLPADIDLCVSQDLDEALQPGWRQELDRQWFAGITRVHYRFQTNDGPEYWHEKIHARHGYLWKYPVHERLIHSGDERSIFVASVKAHEVQDQKKPRNYFDLNLKAVEEGDRYWKRYFFLAQDAEMLGNLDDARRYRVTAYEMCGDGGLAKSYIARVLGRAYQDIAHDEAERWYQKAIQDDPTSRETYFSYARFLQSKHDWPASFAMARKALSLTDQPTGFTYDPQAWGCALYDVLALAAWNLGMVDLAIEYGSQACELNPQDERLQSNLRFYRQK